MTDFARDSQSAYMQTDRAAGKIVVVGAGFMGCTIAAIYASYGYEVVVNDIQDAALSSSRERCLSVVRGLAAAGKSPDDILRRITRETNLAMALKGDVFRSRNHSRRS
jgi:3-hydroxybutyryl-CoA dehydrogenase